jgi:hypothetical protein
MIDVVYSFMFYLFTFLLLRIFAAAKDNRGYDATPRSGS